MNGRRGESLTPHQVCQPGVDCAGSERSSPRGHASVARFASLLASLSLTMTLTGCLRPYSHSLLDPAAANFPGIASHWHQDSQRTVRVIFVHGMCTHTEDGWINQGWDRTIPAYFSSAAPSGKTVTSVGGVDLHDREYRIGLNTISARFIVWSKLTAADKGRIQFDNAPPAPGEFTWKRAKLNASLKQGLLNDCLSDAVIYAGYRSAELQAAMQNAICAALDGSPDNGVCDFPPSYLHGERSIVLVTESLGSRMVFDAISSLKIQAARQGEQSLDAFYEAVAPISQIYIPANQLPLLALARPAIADVQGAAPASAGAAAAGAAPAMKAALQVLSEARSRHARRRMTSPNPASAEGSISIVAFTDPNDLLSYRIPPNDQSILGSGATLVNVITSNAGALFGLVENPLPAHTTYNQNPDVLKLLFGGSRRSTGE